MSMKTFHEAVDQGYQAAQRYEEDVIIVEEGAGYEFYTNSEAIEADAPCGLMTVRYTQTVFEVADNARRIYAEYINKPSSTAYQIAKK